MSVFFDSSALLALHVESAARPTVREALERSITWSACALALSEAVAAIARLTDEDVLRRHLEDRVRHSWDFFHVVPVDQALLDDAAALCARQPVGLSAALHLSAAARLPGPVEFVTFESGHIPVAMAMGFSVVSG